MRCSNLSHFLMLRNLSAGGRNLKEVSRLGRTGFSLRFLVFGFEKQLVASGLDHYLETPDDAALHALERPN